jgi:N-acetylmuramoyl-L-alanine amidase
VDIYHTAPAAPIISPTPSIPQAISAAVTPEIAEKPASAIKSRKQQRPFIVAIDAGHGGEDPGAVGPRGAREKNVVMQISRELQLLVNKEPGMKAYLTRDGDYFVPLRTRIDKARMAQADLFISIHADAFKDRRAHGASVFSLSAHGASSEAARWIAEQENRSDLIGGVSLDDKDQMLASILLDLSQTASNAASLTLGDAVLSQIKPIAPLHGSKRVQQAGFLVLKSPDIPSILVETEFISNPAAEQKLTSKSYQRQMASAIMHGIKQYRQTSGSYHEQVTLMVADSSGTGSRQHTIRSGDTLSLIAQQYGVSVAALKQYNGLMSDVVRIGQTLKIPS